MKQIFKLSKEISGFKDYDGHGYSFDANENEKSLKLLAEKLNEVIETLNLFIPRDLSGTYKCTRIYKKRK